MIGKSCANKGRVNSPTISLLGVQAHALAMYLASGHHKCGSKACFRNSDTLRYEIGLPRDGEEIMKRENECENKSCWGN